MLPLLSPMYVDRENYTRENVRTFRAQSETQNKVRDSVIEARDEQNKSNFVVRIFDGNLCETK